MAYIDNSSYKKAFEPIILNAYIYGSLIDRITTNITNQPLGHHHQEVQTQYFTWKEVSLLVDGIVPRESVQPERQGIQSIIQNSFQTRRQEVSGVWIISGTSGWTLQIKTNFDLTEP